MNKLVSDGSVKKINYPVLYVKSVHQNLMRVGNALWHMFINHHGVRFLKILTL